MNQVLNQQIQEQVKQAKMLEKANYLVLNHRVRRSQCKESSNIWMVSSFSTPKKWYVVRWDTDLDGFTCACKSFEYSSDNMCLHIAACAIFEGMG